MRPETIKKLCCPFDKADLELTEVVKDREGKILEGFFWCTQCKRIYPIVKGIPIMNPDEYREFNLEKPMLDRWQKHLTGKKIENFRLVDDGGEGRLEIGTD
ncbi:Trm112 family protein [Roseivirga sp. BDSF3-8]|uniref:Trm112 family protein n=1 Tax=Roseivirga sp. BDSF3-8 TaxID=3241598 RepID=UPI0035320FF5